MESNRKWAQSVDSLRQLQIRGSIYGMRDGRNRRGAVSLRGELQYRNSGRVRRQPQPESGALQQEHPPATIFHVIVVFESGDSGGLCAIQRAKYRRYAVCDLCETERSE